MADRTIQAYFRNLDEAQGASLKLQALRASEVRVEQRADGGEDGTGMLAAAGLYGLGAQGTTSSFGGGVGAAAFAAVDDDIVDADGGGDRSERQAILTAHIDDDVYMQALQAIRESGGLV